MAQKNRISYVDGPLAICKVIRSYLELVIQSSYKIREFALLNFFIFSFFIYYLNSWGRGIIVRFFFIKEVIL